MRHRSPVAWLIGLTVLGLTVTGQITQAVQLNGSYHRHCNLDQNNHCIHSGYICWCNILVGPVDETLCGIDGTGNLDGEAVEQGGTQEVVFVFQCDFGVPGDSLGFVPVLGDTELSPEVSNALGYNSVTILDGVYPVDYANHEFGETRIAAILSGPTPVRAGSWGVVKSLYR